MRYAGTHKDETHRKLLKAASAGLREKGPDRLSVQDIMNAVGLTHGGFYAHFKSKDALLVEAVMDAFARSAARFCRVTEDMPPNEALTAYIDLYVSLAHRDNHSGGCPIVALNSDIPRQSKQFRAAFEAGINQIAETLSAWIAAIGHPEPMSLARSVLSAMAGAVALSRAIPDKSLANAMLASARDGIKARLNLQCDQS